MANAGFSAPSSSGFPSVTGLVAKSSEAGKSSQLATALNTDGDIAAHDVYGETEAPSCEFIVTDEVDLSDIELGEVNGGIMLTQIVVTTQAGQMPTVTMQGQKIESGGTAQRTYPISGTIKPRSKAQDVAGAFSSSDTLTACTTTYRVEPHFADLKGEHKASDCSDGRIEAQGTWTCPSGAISPTAGSNFTITTAATNSNPDSDYVTVTATATKFIEGTEQSAGSGD